MKTFIHAVVALLASSCAAAQELPALSNGLCDYDTIYDQIKTGNVIEVTLTVRHRNCPANRGNKPCRAENSQGFAPGPLLDGVQTDNAIMVNDEIPGPEIRARLGDTIRVNVVNLLGEPTTMHFHGMTQFRTPFMDGDEMISNCPIAAGHSHTYEFIAHPVGSTYYHSHSGTQRIAGMTGPLIIEDPEEPHAELDERVVFIQDWYHQNSDSNFEFWGQNMAPNCVTFGGNYFTGIMNDNGIGPVTGDGYPFQSFIINGEGIYDYQGTQMDTVFMDMTDQEKQCPGQTDQPPRCEYCLNTDTWTAELCETSSSDSLCGQPHVIEAEAGVETRLRFIHAGALFAAHVCIDGLPVDIITADGNPVEKHSTDCFIIYPGERYDALVMPSVAGDRIIRFTTTEQQPNPESGGPDEVYPGFPHQSVALLRAIDTQSPDTITYLNDTSPVACSDDVTTNCGPDYWLSSKTMGCSVLVSKNDPDRCMTTYDALVPATYANDDATLCGDLKMAHEVDPTVKTTVQMSFAPDQVPRWEMVGLNTRLEILSEEDWGFPYTDPATMEASEVHTPISFVNPEGPVLSLPPELREEIYARRTVVRPSDETNEGELYPNYATGFSAITTGVNTVSVDYGDVVRIFFKCDKAGPGCAMPHPMHLHGNKMAVLYVGQFDEAYDESKFNPNPIYRDTVTVNTDSWVVVQVAAVNPGAWRLHCHVNIHHKSGMAMLLDVGGGEAEAVRATPSDANLCPLQPETSSSTADGGDGTEDGSGSTGGDGTEDGSGSTGGDGTEDGTTDGTDETEPIAGDTSASVRMFGLMIPAVVSFGAIACGVFALMG